MHKKNVFGGLFMLATSLGFSQVEPNVIKPLDLDEVVLSDSRFKIKRENSGKTIVKITSKELEQNAGKTITELINTKSGITVNGNYGQAGSVLNTFVRGGQNRQVLVLIDGIALSDPSQIENNFDLNLLSPNQIESIEILKGASSALYGNRASTAVINITLKKASKEKVNAVFSSFFGTNNAQNESRLDVTDFTNTVNINGTVKDFNYMVNFSNTYTDGLSAIRASENNAPNESDTFSKYAANVKLGYTVADNFEVSAYANLDNYTTDFDGSFFLIDENNVSKNKQYRFGIAPKYTYTNGSVTVNAAVNTVEREFESAFPSLFDAKTLVIDAFNKYKVNAKLYTILGVNYVKSEMNNTSDFTNISSVIANDEIVDPYASVTYISDFGLNINAGIRLNNHSEYGSNFVYNLNPSYTFNFNENKLKILSSFSTAYVTPSLYQLFVPFYGNTNLKPQEDITIEAGFEATVLENKLRFSALYFNRDQTNFIDFVTLDFVTFESEYQNVDSEFIVNGVEVELDYKVTEALKLNANYTFTERKEGVILRVPKQKVNAGLNYSINNRTNLGLNYQFTGKRTAAAFEDDFINRRTLNAFNIVNLNANHSILNGKMKIFAGVSNLFNEDYEEVYRFSTRGRNYRLGFNLNL